MNSPAVTVVMPVFNAAEFLKDSVEKLLNQSFRDFELIIVDDGSTDGSGTILQTFTDSRVRLIRLSYNHGIPTARNIGLELATGKYICITDADDLSRTDRLEKQISYMEKHPEIGLAGCFCELPDRNRILTTSLGYEILKIKLLAGNPFSPSSLILRKTLTDKYSICFNKILLLASDYDFIIRCSSLFPVANIPESLIQCRLHHRQMSVKYDRIASFFTKQVLLRHPFIAGLSPSPEEEDVHWKLMRSWTLEPDETDTAGQWTDKLLRTNQKEFYFNPRLFKFFLNKKLQTVQP